MKTNENEQNPHCGNLLLAEVLSEYGFESQGVRGTKWKRMIDNDTNCQSKVFLHLLNGNEVVRLSVAESEAKFIDAIDMFETKDMDKIRRFMELVMF